MATAPLASADSTAQADGTIAVGSLGSSTVAPGSTTGSLGPFGSLASPAYAEYVALGDSYAALGDNRAQTGKPELCARSLANYAHRLDANPAVGELTDVTCGGAQIPNLAGTQTLGTAPNQQTAPAQFDALSEDTDLVTLSIGGNDVGFGAIVACITRQGPFKDLPGGATCESEIGAEIDNSIATTYAEDGPIDEVYDTIAELSPDATIVATQYMPLMPAAGTTCAIVEQFNPADVTWAREITEDINAAVNTAARRNEHISVLPTDTVDRSACAKPDQRWTSFFGVGDNTAPMHPTALGQEAMAAAIAAEL